MQNDLTFIKHILDCISNINDFVKDVSYSELKNNVMLQSAILYQFMVIGEAAGNISKEFQNNHQGIPWGEIIGMRNKLIHHYFGVDLEVVWETVYEDLPELERLIKKEGLGKSS